MLYIAPRTCFTALGVLCCFALFVCLTLLASFFLPSHLSFKNMYMFLYTELMVSLFIRCTMRCEIASCAALAAQLVERSI